MDKTLNQILAILCHITCIISIILSGLFVCINCSFVTHILSSGTNTYEYTAYSKEQVADAAVLTRNFSVGDITYPELENMLNEIGVNPNDLDQDMIDHLAECTPIFKCISIVEIVCVIASVLLSFLSVKIRGKDAALKTLKIDAILAIIIFIALGLLMVLSFDALFTNMHKLFFKDGTWTFAYDSLLICMYPQNFWIGMGIIWCSISALISIILIIVTNTLKKCHKIENVHN